MTPVDRDGYPLALVSIHAHPDDEASKGAGTVAQLSEEGVRCVLVCATNGEAGDILNPAVDTPEVRADLKATRLAELAESVRILGYEECILLGYHDSGMPDTDVNHRADNFANAPMDEVIERLVRIIRAERPQVVVTYGDDRAFYPHPDHVRVHEASVPAFAAAGDPEQFPDAGEPWQPSKLYYSGFSKRRVTALDAAFRAQGEESPFAQWLEHEGFSSFEDPFTTFVDVSDYLDRRRDALLAHRTQVDPEGFWMKLPNHVVRETFPWEEFVRVRSIVEVVEPEDDLFAGLRA